MHRAGIEAPEEPAATVANAVKSNGTKPLTVHVGITASARSECLLPSAIFDGLWQIDALAIKRLSISAELFV